ncbi:MAG TPA: ATP-binding protein [Thermoanaerobaculia bacterium]|nr:ATP-binding protein [Thermoanaerobaculia bacterium]
MAASTFSRRLLIASVVFALFVLADIALFSWLIFRSLSQREVERVLLETKAQAQTLAGQIAHRAATEKDLYTAVAIEKETQTFIDQMLSQRDVVSTLQIHDKNGNLVFEGRKETHVPTNPQAPPGRSPAVLPPLPGSPELQRPIGTPRVEQTERTTELLVPETIEVPIGDYGSLQIGISAGQLQKRIEVLRSELIRQTEVIGVSSIALLTAAFAAVWWLLRRAQRLELQAAEARRLAYIGTLASGLAHEIRNPLNSLNLNMQMLEEEIGEGGPAPTGKRLLSITRSEISRLERLVTDFLAYAKPRPLELEETPAVRLLDRLREVLAGEIQKRGAQIEVEDRSGGARVKVDPGQMNQLFLNLAQNAFSAAEEAGRPPVIKLAAYRQGPAVCLEMADNGIGMTSEEQAQIFDLFYSNRKGGTGLGLAIVDRIVRAHGGRVGVRSSKGVGTAIIVELPAASPSEPAHRAAVEAPAGA